MIPVVCCDLCYSRDFHFLYTIEKSKPSFDVVKCKSCGLIFQNPRFSDEEINSFYSKDYYAGNADYSYIDERENFTGSSYVWNKRLDKISKFITSKDQNKAILDIGCSFGGFMLCAMNKGFEPYGIDLSEYSTTYAREKLDLKNAITGEFCKGIYSESFFDAVTMIEVIEHVKNPKETINEVFSILKPGGLFVIQTANFDAYQAKSQGKNYHYYLPGHLYYFSKKTLTRYLTEAGFKKIKVFHGVDFGLMPKLKKSAGAFKRKLQYLQWIRISLYHLKSKVYFNNFALTSSMVIYATK